MSARYGQGICEEILDERHEQDKKWGEQNHEPAAYLAILAEEFGEAAKEVVEATWARTADKRQEALEKLRVELIQTAAVALVMIQCLDRRSEEAHRQVGGAASP